MGDSGLNEAIQDWSSHVFGLAKMYDIELNYSEDSVQKVEKLCEIIYRQIVANPRIQEESIDKASRMIGAYLGDLIVRNMGGKWELKENGVISLRYKGFECYPIGKVYKRLKNGSEDSIEFYYKVCKDQMTKQ